MFIVRPRADLDHTNRKQRQGFRSTQGFGTENWYRQYDLSSKVLIINQIILSFIHQNVEFVFLICVFFSLQQLVLQEGVCFSSSWLSSSSIIVKKLSMLQLIPSRCTIQIKGKPTLASQHFPTQNWKVPPTILILAMNLGMVRSEQFTKVYVYVERNYYILPSMNLLKARTFAQWRLVSNRLQ